MTFLRLVACALLSLAGACAFTTDLDRYRFDDRGDGDASLPDGGPGADGGPDAGEPVDPIDPDAPLPCATAGELELGVPVDTSTLLASDGFTSTCGGAGAPDLVYELRAPTSTFYRITTEGSAIDTVLSVREPSCASPAERVCNDDRGALSTSEIVLPLDAGERVLVVVDGNAETGAVRVLAEVVSCPSTPLSVGTSIDHTSVGRADNHASPCGGADAGDASYRFVPEADGFYAIRATKGDGPTRTALAVERGPVCGGPMLQCNAGEDGRSEVVRFLRAGEPVTVWVDGLDPTKEGPYSLVVEPRPGVVCGESGALESEQSVATTLAEDDAHRFSTSCASTSTWWFDATDPAEIHDFPDRTFTFEIPQAGSGCFVSGDVTVTARFPFVAAVLEGDDCSGREIACNPTPTVDETNPLEPVWSLSISPPSPPPGAPRTRTLVVDRPIDYRGYGTYPLIPTGDELSVSVQFFVACALAGEGEPAEKRR